MSGIKDQSEIDEMRRRLYERGNDIKPNPRHELSGTETKAPATWTSPLSQSQKPTANKDPRLDTLTEPEISISEPAADKTIKENTAKKYSYRSIILIAGIASFILAVLLSSLYMIFGNNQISNQNIGISLSGPLTIGGGEVLPLQATVTNQNRVPIESAVLIVRFPSGTKSADGSGRDVIEDRIQLERINAGETINVPVRAIVFGEENQERTISAEVEYRLVDSNGTFYKRAEPFNFSIHSAPLIMRIKNIERVSSGQEVTIDIELQSNAVASLRDVLVTADYPINFDFSEAEPAPDFRQNTWLIKEIQPEQTTSLQLKGVVLGNQDEEFQIQFTAGSPRQDNQFTIGSMLASGVADFVIEQPFVRLTSSINRSTGSVVTTDAGNNTAVEIVLENTLTETLYDVALEVSVSGNVLSRQDVIVNNGFYDSINDVIRFDVSGDDKLAEIPAGSTRRFTFSIMPSEEQRTPVFEITASAFARRVSENNVTEALIGTVETEVRYTSSVSALSQVQYVSGPVPPVADETTIYDITMAVTAGGNDITGAVVTSSLPQYVDWVSADDAVADQLIFNPVSKEITWNIGDMSADERKLATFRVAFTPSQAQIGRTPALFGTTRLRATDRFTGVVIRAEDSPKSTELSAEAGFGRDSGRVQAAMVESPDEE